MTSSLRNLLFIAVFSAAIALPLVQTMIETTKTVQQQLQSENRALAKPPSLSEKFRLRRFTERFDRYYRDNFGFRSALIDGYEHVNDTLFGSDEYVIRGDDGWMFLTKGLRALARRRIPVLHDLCGLTPFSDAELGRWLGALKKNRDYLAKRNIEYLFVPMPNKHGVHRSQLPSWVGCDSERETRLDQLFDALRHDGSVRFIDLRPEFATRVGQGELLYHPTDTHWNGLGMLAGYRRVIAALPPSLKVNDASLTGVEAPATMVRRGDLWRLIGGALGATESSHALSLPELGTKRIAKAQPKSDDNNSLPFEVWTSPHVGAPRALIMHDSFFATDIKFLLAASFSRTTFIASAYPNIDPALFEQHNPEVVVHEMVERTLLQPIFE